MFTKKIVKKGKKVMPKDKKGKKSGKPIGKMMGKKKWMMSDGGVTKM